MKRQRLSPFLALSFLAHLGFALILSLSSTPFISMNQTSSNVSMSEEARPAPFEIVQLSPEQMQRMIRRAGVKGGNKESFSAPVPQSTPRSAVQTNNQPLELGKLAPSDNSAEIIEGQKKPLAPAPENQISLAPNPDQAQRIQRQQQQIQGHILRELLASAHNSEILNTTGFNVQFDPPEGIPEDELNSVEKIFYSFQRRTFYNYVTTFISNYQSLLIQKPHIKQNLERDSYHLMGRVEFDRDGHVVSMRLIRTSQNDDINMMFETTLKNLKLPNPPNDLLNTSERFVIHYQLRIN